VRVICLKTQYEDWMFILCSHVKSFIFQARHLEIHTYLRISLMHNTATEVDETHQKVFYFENRSSLQIHSAFVYYLVIAIGTKKYT